MHSWHIQKRTKHVVNYDAFQQAMMTLDRSRWDAYIVPGVFAMHI